MKWYAVVKLRHASGLTSAKTFKKVAEEMEFFEDNYATMMNSPTMPQAQKEKLEEVLKKSIKKLQKFRDSIKTWASSNDIKDKAPLLERRKAIETVCPCLLSGNLF